ncbi:aspartyl protease family protein [Pseudarcicella hirudinis]|uniref:aspartyl protease family protein n=1 Tax=Pseudarcicella hirudinis TaxID=1079859 RepID=UPI0035E80BBB
MKRYLRIILIKIILIAALPVIGYSQKGEADTVQLLANSLTSPARVSKNKDKLRMSLLSEEKYGFQLINKRQKQTRIPFELQSNLIVVPVKINNSDTLHFILDTGVSSIIITDPKVATMQHMKALRKVRIAGAGEGKDIQASVVLNNTLQMGDMIGFRQNLVVLDDDVLQLSQFVGSQIHGIIGYDIFNRFVVTIDFVSREIVLQNPEDYVYKPKKGMKFPISIEENKPYFSSLELVDSDKVTPLKVVLDTGAGHALSIDLAKSTTLHTPDKVVKPS